LTPDLELTRTAERLITRHVDSVGALDLLLLLHAGRDRDWSIAELCEALGCPASWARARLQRLDGLGLVMTVDGRHRFRRDPTLGPDVDELARVCRTDRAAVTRLIFTRPAAR
jgi:DNA-binding IclR family transcriptional regulator